MPPVLTAGATQAAAPGPAQRPLLGGTGERLALLFPAPPAQQQPSLRRSGWRRACLVLACIAVVCAGAAILLVRQAGTPSWQTLWAGDGSIFLPRALSHPWSSLLQEYAGYVQLVPQVLADVIARFPLRYAAAGFAISGALITASCALFASCASSGHIRRPELRALLGCSVVLLPTAVIEIANSGVDAQWYLMFALFWALLWRPRSRSGMAVAALIAFATMATNLLNLLYLPLVAARVIALPRRQEHAASYGWLAGVALQVVGVLQSHEPHRLGPLLPAAHFYGQHVLVAAVFGWRLALSLQGAIGVSACIALAALVVVSLACWVMLSEDGHAQAFTVAALVMGLILTAIPVLIRFWVAAKVSTSIWVPGSRFTASAILLIDGIAIVGVDAFLRRSPVLDRAAPEPGQARPDQQGGGRPRARRYRVAQVVVAALLVAGLGTGWYTSFRYQNERSFSHPWSQTYQRYARRVHPAASTLMPTGRVR